MANESPTRVLICDDHTIVRQGLDALLNSLENVNLVGTATTGLEAISLCRKLAPNVVLMDLMMPGLDGITAIRAITEQNPSVAVIALTSYDSQELVEGALNAGAVGYLLKNISRQELADAIETARKGLPALSPEAVSHLVKATTHPRIAAHELTRREQEVLKLMADGLNNAHIAELLSVSPFTVKNHVSSILSKLGATTRTEAVSLAIKLGLVELNRRSNPGMEATSPSSEN